MNEFYNAPVTEGAAKPAPNPPKTYEPLPRSRLFLGLTLCFCVLLADILLTSGRAALGLTTAIFAWYALVLAQTGMKSMARRDNRILFLFNLFLALMMAISSNETFKTWNTLALLALIPLHTATLSGADLFPWYTPLMFRERFCRVARGLFCHLGAARSVLRRHDTAPDSRRLSAVILGGTVSLALVVILVPVLASADALFAAATETLRKFLYDRLFSGIVRFAWGLVLTPFVFGLLYSLRRPEQQRIPSKGCSFSWDALGSVMILSALDTLYLLFLAVQSAGLFGGPDYLAARGISYAEWARTGFFQMVGVTLLNLTVILASFGFSRREGRCWSALRRLSAVLVLESLVLLASAAWRMTLYVGAYGLSFKRFMTYWGMVMMALFFMAAAHKIRVPAFSFCRVAFPLALAGWLVINCIPVDYLVAKNQVDRYLDGKSSSLSVEYLVSLSYDTLHQLDRLAGKTIFSEYSGDCEVDQLLLHRRERAAHACADWHTWSLSAALAADK